LAWAISLSLLLGWGMAPGVARAAESLALLTNAQQVLDLGADQARRSPHPVALKGVVTFRVVGNNSVFIQDATAGILVLNQDPELRLEPGQAVELKGRVGAGLLSPIVTSAVISVTGTAPLPEPKPASASRLAAGDYFGQWVQIEGGVRDVAREPQRLIIFVSSGGIRFHAVIQSYPEPSIPTDWLDAKVQLRGICWTDVDRENKPAGFTLYLPDASQLTVLKPGSSNIFGLPAVTPAARASLTHQSDQRLRMSGTVLFQSAEGLIFLRDETGPFQARPLAPLAKANPYGLYLDRAPVPRLAPGTRVEVVGAPTDTAFVPALQDAEVRVIDRAGPAPEAKAISTAEALSGRYDHELVTLKGRVVARDWHRSGSAVQQVLVLQNGDVRFEVQLNTGGTTSSPAFAENAVLQATGLCLTQVGEGERAQSFRLLARDPGELRFLGRAPPWASWHVERILGVAAVLGLGALAWIGMLRRRVAQRTVDLVRINRQLEAEITERQRAQGELRHALAAERELGELKSRFVSMVSHEFRTPLGIIMSSTEILQSYLDRLSPVKRQEHLNDIFQSTRRMSDLMEEVLLLGRVEAGRVAFKPEALDLAGLCRRLIDELTSATPRGVAMVFEPKGLTDDARGDETLLRHILTNLLSNAVKYSANGQPVRFSVERQGTEAVFVIADRGIGIPEPDSKQLYHAFHRGRNVGERPGTGLGLVIVKRCVELHRGTIAFESREGEGTTFTVRLPLFEPVEGNPNSRNPKSEGNPNDG
jgi:signal transduction histidine kinase